MGRIDLSRECGSKLFKEMKRKGKLWEEVVDAENLLLAAYKASKGRGYQKNVLALIKHQEKI